MDRRFRSGRAVVRGAAGDVGNVLLAVPAKDFLQIVNMTGRTAIAIALLLAACGIVASEEAPKMAEPRYAEGNQLIRPEGYRQWMFVGANLGMGYTEGKAAKTPAFHNIFIQPDAYRRFAAMGKFPDKTMLVMEVVTAGTNASINRNGHF